MNETLQACSNFFAKKWDKIIPIVLTIIVMAAGFSTYVLDTFTSMQKEIRKLNDLATTNKNNLIITEGKLNQAITDAQKNADLENKEQDKALMKQMKITSKLEGKDEATKEMRQRVDQNLADTLEKNALNSKAVNDLRMKIAELRVIYEKNKGINNVDSDLLGQFLALQESGLKDLPSNLLKNDQAITELKYFSKILGKQLNGKLVLSTAEEIPGSYPQLQKWRTAETEGIVLVYFTLSKKVDGMTFHDGQFQLIGSTRNSIEDKNPSKNTSAYISGVSNQPKQATLVMHVPAGKQWRITGGANGETIEIEDKKAIEAFSLLKHRISVKWIRISKIEIPKLDSPIISNESN
ncbi:hypothetical protein [Gimesia fumaroli]|uniref:Uncharacterized protein n=1 Tax=Gimesia fumaroli TaxID=2527976 RepID=A0A518I925_9PLAN|nr:hypothetical protein [Gimesia fumaroli]QDV49549.1 hypothetical protein Enr17x_15690 [Gimesia fumaroli]